MTNKNYDVKDPKSIEGYAMKLVGKTFMDVIVETSNNNQEVIEAYGNRFRKGGLGNLLEELYFGYKANSDQAADFQEAGVELKASPYEYTKKGELRAGERLVLTMITYDGPIEADFYKSHAWEKMRQILLIYYYRNKLLNNNLMYKIGYAGLFTPPEQDLIIIKADYDFITDKITRGLAHELSEGDTMYLGACTKGATAAKSTVPQYYGDHTPAKKRAYCFKNSYMTFVLNHYLANKGNQENCIIKADMFSSKKSFEEILMDIMTQYFGMSDKELCEKFGREYNNNKAQWIDLAYKMLGVRDNRAEEFEKANIVVKAIRIEENGKMRENMSFPPFKFKDLVQEEYSESTLHDYFDETRFFFVVWKKDGDVYRVAGAQLWNMPYEDLSQKVKEEWEQVQRIIKYGVVLTKNIDSKGKISFSNNFPNKTETEVIHVRPHAQKAAYRLNNGEEYGNVDRDANELPNGEYMTTQSFWINNSYIMKQLNCLKDDQKNG